MSAQQTSVTSSTDVAFPGMDPDCTGESVWWITRP